MLGGGRVAEVLWLVSGPGWASQARGVVTEQGVGGWSPFTLHPARVLGLRVLGRSLSLGACPAPPLPVGHRLIPSPFWACSSSLIRVSVRMEHCGLGKAWRIVGAQPTELPAPPPWPQQLLAPESPSVPSRLLGIILALMTLNSELLTWEFLETKHSASPGGT